MHVLSKATYTLFAIIAPMLFLIAASFGAGIEYFLLATFGFELYIWFIFLLDYVYFGGNDNDTLLRK